MDRGGMAQVGPCGAIDLGGTKIEARLFDAGMATLATRRIPTPAGDAAALVGAIVAQVRWLEQRAGDPALPVAVAMAGLIDPASGVATAANLAIDGHCPAPMLARALGRPVPLVNDCMAFAWSEAQGGAGAGARSVLGLVIGTGIGAGLVCEGRLAPRHAGLAVEIGHVGMPARALARHGLAPAPCGCGRAGCHEAHLAGPALARLAVVVGFAPDPSHPSADPAAIAAAAAAGEGGAARVMALWADLAGEMLCTAQLMLDPEVIVLGGGLSNIPGLPAMLSEALARLRLGTARAPRILVAQHGDSSGARGAALLARAGLVDGRLAGAVGAVGAVGAIGGGAC